jgi:Cu+-exporting ATPase
MAIQILATSLLVAVPASYFVSFSRPTAILEKRLHLAGTVLCGWESVKDLCGKAVFPLRDVDLFPQGSTKLNGVKFYGDRDPDEVVAYATALITRSGGGLVPVFKQLRANRNAPEYTAENFQYYGNGGIGAEVCGEPVLMGTLNFLQDMGVEIPEGTMVSQAVYVSIDGQLSAVCAISYAKMRSASAGLVTLNGYRKITPLMLCGDFMLTEDFIRSKFDIKTRRIVFPTREERETLKRRRPDPDEPVLAITTREELISAAYAVTGARALRQSVKLGVAIHLIGGILGLIIMLALAYLGSTELLTPTNILLYQLVWAIPGLLVTEWTRIV